jgi:cytochrome P450
MLEYNPLQPAAVGGGMPAELFRDIRRAGGVCRNPEGGWYAGAHQDVLGVVQDVESFLPVMNFSGAEIPDDELFLPEIPEPRHGQIRRIFNAYFGPHRMDRVEPYVRMLCAGLLAPLVEAGRGDLAADFAERVPSRTVAYVLGVPEQEADDFVRWSQQGVLMTRVAETPTQHGTLPIHNYLAQLISERRALRDRPDDLLTKFIETPIEGMPLTDTEVSAQLQVLVVAATETTTRLLGNMLLYLLQHPDTWRRLREDRGLAEPFVEETLRYSPPAWVLMRRCTSDTRVGNVAVRSGEVVGAGIASANRDESVFVEPEAFRLDRPNQRSHLSFGAGRHICPGASLARLEAAVVLDTLIDRVAGIRPIPHHVYGLVPNGSIEPVPAIPCLIDVD